MAWQRFTRALTGIENWLINVSGAIRRVLTPIMCRRLWERLMLWVKGLRSAIIDVGMILVIVVVIGLVAWEMCREIVLIEPIETPKRLADAGYTPYVVASQLMGDLLSIRQNIKKTRYVSGTGDVRVLPIATTRPDISYPEQDSQFGLWRDTCRAFLVILPPRLQER